MAQYSCYETVQIGGEDNNVNGNIRWYLMRKDGGDAFQQRLPVKPEAVVSSTIPGNPVAERLTSGSGEGQ